MPDAAAGLGPSVRSAVATPTLCASRLASADTGTTSALPGTAAVPELLHPTAVEVTASTQIVIKPIPASITASRCKEFATVDVTAKSQSSACIGRATGRECKNDMVEVLSVDDHSRWN
jgi:hypothetical protein